jgi:hypothetical protein
LWKRHPWLLFLGLPVSLLAPVTLLYAGAKAHRRLCAAFGIVYACVLVLGFVVADDAGAK